MGWIFLSVGSNELHNLSKDYVNVVNATKNSVEPNPSKNITTHDTTLMQRSIKQRLKVFSDKVEYAVKK